MRNLLIKNARITTPDEILEQASLEVVDGIIKNISTHYSSASENLFQTIIDAQGSYVLPGIIDIHTDAIEKEISPRPGANFPIEIAFRELERRMSGCGITTVYHSLYLGYYAAEVNDTMDRKQMFETVSQLCKTNTIIDNKIHLRFEVTGVEEYMTCLDLIEKGCVQMLSFMDHTPGQGQYGLEKYSKYLKSSGYSEAAIREKIEESLNQPRLSREQMETISYICAQNNIPIASHDDDHPDKVAFMHGLGATICEFPINLEAARKGIDLSMFTVGGAANVLRGGSLSGNLHVEEAIRAGMVNTLCSDYYPPAILHSIFRLHQTAGIPLHETVKLATLNAAKAARIATEKGSIEPDKDADLIIVDFENGTPWVTHTILKGRPVAQAALNI